MQPLQSLVWQESYIRLPELAPGHFEHFNVVGLESLIDCADALHLGWIERNGLSTCEERGH